MRKFCLIFIILIFPLFLYSKSLKIQTGIYFLDLAQIDLRDNSFFADFYIWYKCIGKGSGEWSIDQIEYMNGQISDRKVQLKKEINPGEFVYCERVKGVFRARFNFQRYPFDKQKLEIFIEDSSKQIKELVFEIDKESMFDNKPLFDQFLEIPGWKISNSDFKSEVHYYATDFGDKKPDSKGENYSRFSVSVTITRLFAPHLIKFVIPLVVIAGMAYMVFFINAREFEAQCGICVTALLSAVALHTVQADALPAVGYLVVADRIFIFFYLIIFMALVQTVAVNNYAKKGNTESAEKLDVLFRYAYPVSIVIGSFAIALF